MKILMIEDRIVRKEQFLVRSGIDFGIYSFLEEISPEDFIRLKRNIKDLNKTIFNDYDLLITHKSAFTLNEQDFLASLGKSIIYFSGGISQSFYLEHPFPCLHMNTTDFYSYNLVQFLNHVQETGEIEILILQFGAKWKLNLFLNSRDKLNQLFYKNSGNYISPERFDLVFSDKLISIINSFPLRNSIVQLLEDGLALNDFEKRHLILNELNSEIIRQIDNTL